MIKGYVTKEEEEQINTEKVLVEHYRRCLEKNEGLIVLAGKTMSEISFHELLQTPRGISRSFHSFQKKMSKEKCKLISKKYGFDSEIINEVDKAIK